MFETIKRNLFKFFNRKSKEKVEAVSAEFTTKLIKVGVDPKERLRKKLNYIVRNTKSFRIRKKNIRRIGNLNGNSKNIL